MKLDKSYKVRVNPKQSRKIQELVFGLGGKWNGGTDWVINEIIPFLYVTSGLVMTCDSKAQEYFGYTSSENTEIQADDLIALLTDLSKSAENPLQDAELTPEFEAVEPKFKVGDKVYRGLKGEIRTVERVEIKSLHFAEGGCDFIKHCCHATQENYERLQATFPDIEFERPPITGDDLLEAMLKKGIKNVLCFDKHGNKHVITDKAGIMFVDIDGFNSCSGLTPIDWTTDEPLTESVLDE